MLRALTLALVAAACATIAVGIVVSTACITAPPPELPTELEHRPTILRASVVPPTEVLSQLPTGGFIVPIKLEDPNELFQWDVFVDYNFCTNPPDCTMATSEVTPPGVVQVTPTGALDGGVVLVSFDSPPGLDLSQCHSIDFEVAQQFQPGLPHSPDPTIGGDSFTWIYEPAGVTCSSIVYDAGPLQDGAFPPADAGADALPVIPESGTD
jgi:hypothetical protein